MGERLRRLLRPIDAVLLVRGQLPEGLGEAVGLEHRIVAETGLAARRPDGLAENTTLEQLLMPIRPRDHQGRHEMGAAGRRIVRDAAFLQLALYPRHGGWIIP